MEILEVIQGVHSKEYTVKTLNGVFRHSVSNEKSEYNAKWELSGFEKKMNNGIVSQ